MASTGSVYVLHGGRLSQVHTEPHGDEHIFSPYAIELLKKPHRLSCGISPVLP